MTSCRICGGLTERLFELDSDISLISSAFPIKGKTVLDVCSACGHTQTKPIVNLEQYYSEQYQFRIASEEEDDVYDHVGGRNVYRSEHQARSVANKAVLHPGLKVCDYGCGKGRSLQFLVRDNPGIIPYVFDVSDAYRPFWEKFVPESQQASFSMPEAWHQQMDVVLSFFALEHVEDPRGFMRSLRWLLKDGGRVHLVVPNMMRNVSDMIVVDHVNHFSRSSLEVLFREQGFEIDEIDEDFYRGAFVVSAQATAAAPTQTTFSKELDRAPREVASFWQSALEKIRDTDLARPSEEPTAIYGSGIYGLFIASVLSDRRRVRCFLDQNEFRHGMSLLGIPVCPPGSITDDISMIYVALNPNIARQAVDDMPALRRRDRDFFFL